MSVAKNAPCPCGSGKKYKKCCLLRANPPALSWSPEERERMLQGLALFVDGKQFKQQREYAFELCLGDLDHLATEDYERVMKSPASRYSLTTYLCFDVRLGEHDEPLAQRFLKRYGAKLNPGERCYLERAVASCVGIYEATRVEAERGVELLDLQSKQTVWLDDPASAGELGVSDVIAARLLVGPQGGFEIDGQFHSFTHAQAFLLLRVLAEYRRGYREDLGVGEASFMKRYGAALINRWWVNEIFLPSLLDEDDWEAEDEEEAFPYRVRLEARDPELVREAFLAPLAQARGLYADGPALWVWLENANTEHEIVLGELRLAETRLTCDVASREIAERVFEFLSSLAGEETLLLEGIDALEAETQEREESVVDSLVGEKNSEDSMRAWLDEPTPLLDDRTPRQALEQEEYRLLVVAMLKDLEREIRRVDQAAGEQAFDLDSLWAELGLNRDGTLKR